MTSQSTIAYPPESLRRIEAWLIKHNYVAHTKRVSPGTPWRGPAVPSTTTGWLLTWSARTMTGWAECGSLWVADGVGPSPITTLFTSESTGSRASNPNSVASTPEK